VVWQDGEFVLEDLGSHNGSFVNQEKVERRVLKHGDRLRFGSGGRVQFQLVNQDEEKILVSLYEAAAHDGLTGVFNRRYFNERLRVELEHAVRRGSGLSVLIVDVDHFKQVNDTHGHLGGDEVLRAMCRLVCRSLDTDAVMARYGGEEFVVLMREGSQANAVAVAERLRTGIEELEIRLDETVLKVTVSIGVSTLRPADGKDVSGSLLLARADEALYRAKNEGRNRVVAG
jgi:diguanylate cyclase (GGDEF)-like protein